MFSKFQQLATISDNETAVIKRLYNSCFIYLLITAGDTSLIQVLYCLLYENNYWKQGLECLVYK